METDVLWGSWLSHTEGGFLLAPMADAADTERPLSVSI